MSTSGTTGDYTYKVADYAVYTADSNWTNVTWSTSIEPKVIGTAPLQVLYEGFAPVRPPLEGNELFLSHRGAENLVFYPRDNKYSQDQSRIVGRMNYFNIQDLLARFFLTVRYHHVQVANWRTYCIGIVSMSPDMPHMHMPMFDYDTKARGPILKDIEKLQTEYSLGTAWVYRTKRGHHVYFPCDYLHWQHYQEALYRTNGCEEFKNYARNAGYSVLRVSAKYTKFDIELAYLVKPKSQTIVKRPHRKGVLAQALLAMGTDTGTHLASLFPLQAHFQEDAAEWVPKRKRSTASKAAPKIVQEPEAVLNPAAVLKAAKASWFLTSTNSVPEPPPQENPMPAPQMIYTLPKMEVFALNAQEPPAHAENSAMDEQQRQQIAQKYMDVVKKRNEIVGYHEPFFNDPPIKQKVLEDS